MAPQLVDVHSPEFRQMLEATLREMLEEFVRVNEERAREASLLERMVRVEESLKALADLQQAHFEATEKRFQMLVREMDKRFEALLREMNARFQAVDKRLSLMQWGIVIGFTLTNLLLVLPRLP